MITKSDKRDKNGRFTHGNPGGGRKPIPADVKDALQGLVPKSVERLSAIIHDSEDDKLVMDAVKVVLDRVFGRAPQVNINDNYNHISDEDGQQMRQKLLEVLDDLRQAN